MMSSYSQQHGQQRSSSNAHLVLPESASLDASSSLQLAYPPAPLEEPGLCVVYLWRLLGQLLGRLRPLFLIEK